MTNSPPMQGVQPGRIGVERHYMLPHILAFALYLAVTLAWFPGVVARIGQGYPHDVGDPVLNAWILWWNSAALPFSQAWWNAPSFFPLADVTAFTETLVGMSVLSTPLIWLTANPTFTYNVLFLLSFPLAAFGAYLLGYQLTGDRRAALVAGAAFGFAPYRVAQMPHLQVLMSAGLPVALFALHRFRRDPRTRWLCLFGSAWLLQGLCNGYYLLYFTLFLGAWALWFLTPREHWRAALKIGLTFGVVALPVVPILLKYRAVQLAHGLERPMWEILFYGGSFSSFLTGNPLLVLWGWLRFDPRPEAELFPGFFVVLLPLACALVAGSKSLQRFKLGRLTSTLGILAFAAGLAALSVIALGGFRIAVGSTTLLSVTRFRKPFTACLTLTALFLASHPGVTDVVRRRSEFAFYVAGALLAALFCLGAGPEQWSRIVDFRAPYAFLLELPGFTSLRVPTRFWMLGILCLASAAGLAFVRLLPTSGRWARVVTGLAVAVIVAEGWPARIEVPLRANPLACRVAPAEAVAYLQLPLGGVVGDLAAMERARVLGLPSINGFSGHIPRHYAALAARLERSDANVLSEVAAFGPVAVAVDVPADEGGRYASFVATQQGVRELSGCGPTVRVFVVPGHQIPGGPGFLGRAVGSPPLRPLPGLGR